MPSFDLSVCLSSRRCACVTFVFFDVCESCAWPISISTGSMGAGEYGLTHGTCFPSCRLELVAVVNLLWIS